MFSGQEPRCRGLKISGEDCYSWPQSRMGSGQPAGSAVGERVVCLVEKRLCSLGPLYCTLGMCHPIYSSRSD
jgi:hypothetical protein